MYDVPKEYRAAIRSPTRKDRMAGKLTLTDGSTIELTDSAVISGSVSVDNQCVSGQELAFGSVYMGQASLQLRTALSRLRFTMQRCKSTMKSSWQTAAGTPCRWAATP